MRHLGTRRDLIGALGFAVVALVEMRQDARAAQHLCDRCGGSFGDCGTGLQCVHMPNGNKKCVDDGAVICGAAYGPCAAGETFVCRPLTQADPYGGECCTNVGTLDESCADAPGYCGSL